MNEVISNKTYTLLFGDHYNNLVVFGNPDAPGEFQNHMKMEFWGENYISFDNEGVKGTPTLDGDRLSFDTPEKTYYWEPKTENQMRWVEVLKVKPSSNKWTLKLSGHEDFEFYYQTPYETEAEKYPGSSIEHFKQDGEDYIRLIYPQAALGFSVRPLNIDGSYAVYHKTKRDDFTLILGKNYRTGKVLHIPRPKATDAAGKSVLCSLNIENGVYTRTIPQSYLDSAVYPVVVNDDFGYWSKGGSAWGTSDSYIQGSKYTAPAGTATSITVYLEDLTAAAMDAKCAIYNGDLSLNGYTEERELSANYDGWETFDIVSGGSLSAADYWLTKWNETGKTFFIFYDAGATNQATGALETYNGFPDTYEADFYNDRKVSIYCTYTPGAGGGNSPTGVLSGPLVGPLGGPI